VNGAGHAEVGGPIDQPAGATSPNGELAAPEGEPAGVTTRGGGAATAGRRRSGRSRRSATRPEGAAAPDNGDGQQPGD
jgi:hypothetical protein